MNFLKRSIGGKTAFATVLASLFAIVVLTTASFATVRAALVQREHRALHTVVEDRRTQIEAYFEIIREQIETFAHRVDIAEATGAFAEAFEQMPTELEASGIDTASLETSVQRYYDHEFRPRLLAADLEWRGTEVYTPASPAGLAAQGLYIATNPNPVGSKLRLDRHEADLSYNEVHARYHPSVRAYLEAFGYYDIFLFDLEGNLVYSVFKETDYGTNFMTGPYRDTNFAEAYRAALRLDDGDVVLTDFRAYEPSYGAAASFTSTPVFLDGERVGVAIFQLPIDRINAIMTTANGLGDTGDTYLVAADGFVRSQSRHATTNTILVKKAPPDAVAASLRGAETFVTDHPEKGAVLAAVTPVNIQGVYWGLIGTMSLSEALKPLHVAMGQLAIASTVVAILALVPGLIIGRMIRKPVLEIVAATEQIANGSFNGRLPENREDELGALTRAMNRFINLIASIVGDVQGSADTVATSSSELSRYANQASERLGTQQEEMTHVSTAVTELSSSIQSVAERCQAAATATREASTQAEEGGQVILSTVSEIRDIAETVSASSEEVKNLGERSERIGEVIQIIEEIAEQTNLLALNAAIEAARAGEHGRGFAVVADEVRKLAERTTKATDEIGETIRAMRAEMTRTAETIEQGAQRVGLAVENAGKAGDALSRIVEQSNEVGTVVNEIAASAGEQGPAAEHVAQSVQQIARIMGETNTLGQQMAGLTGSVSEQASVLRATAQRLAINRRRSDNGPPSGTPNRRSED